MMLIWMIKVSQANIFKRSLAETLKTVKEYGHLLPLDIKQRWTFSIFMKIPRATYFCNKQYDHDFLNKGLNFASLHGNPMIVASHGQHGGPHEHLHSPNLSSGLGAIPRSPLRSRRLISSIWIWTGGLGLERENKETVNHMVIVYVSHCCLLLS